MAFQDALPKNRREMLIGLAGMVVAFGAYQIPGVTLEPAELSKCKLDLVSLQATEAACQTTQADLEKRVSRCWARVREIRGEPVMLIESTPDDGAFDLEPVPAWDPWLETPEPSTEAP